MKFIRRSFRVLAPVLVAFGLSACGGGGGSGASSLPPPPPPASNLWDQMRWDEGRWE